MERQVDLKEISDGKLYGANDLVKADCGGCRGCSACCRGMGNSIVLDPLDCLRLSAAVGLDFSGLLQKHLELHVADGLILPSLKMDETTDACPFLNAEGRCGIHPARPGFCRLFPLGRYYHDRTFSYILQTKECVRSSRTKVRVRKWLDQPGLKEYEQYVSDWHYYLKDTGAALRERGDDESRRQAVMEILRTFYVRPYSGEETFYQEFYERLEQCRR